jgi:acetolactate synthase-1/3 small subunit
MRHVISILLQNEAGALARVASLFSTRGYNIESLSVAPTDDESLSRLTLVTSGSDAVIAQITKQVLKLVDVVALSDMTEGPHIERELALLKFSVPPEAESVMRRRAEDYGVRVLDDHLAHFTVELTGSEERIDEYMAGLPAGVGILAVVRSGPLAITRGPQALGLYELAG